MNYIFDINLATQYGVEEAIMIGNFQFWLNKNKANNYNFINGRYWTFNSIKSFESLFPFWTKKQINRILNSLIEKEILIKDNFNKSPYDRTSWYAFKDENKFLFVRENDNPKEVKAENQIDNSIFPNGKMKEPKWENQSDQMGKYKEYTDINTDINTDNKKEIEKEKSQNFKNQKPLNSPLQNSFYDFPFETSEPIEIKNPKPQGQQSKEQNPTESQQTKSPPLDQNTKLNTLDKLKLWWEWWETNNDKNMDTFQEEYKLDYSILKRNYEALILYCESKGKTYKDYKAAFKNFILKDLNNVNNQQKWSNL